MLRSRCMPRSTSTAGATARIPKGYTDSKKIHAYFEGEFIKANLSRSAVAAEVPPYRSCGCSIEEETRTVIATASLQRHWSGEHHSEWILWWCVKLRQRLHLQHGIGCPRTNVIPPRRSVAGDDLARMAAAKHRVMPHFSRRTAA